MNMDCMLDDIIELMLIFYRWHNNNVVVWEEIIFFPKIHAEIFKDEVSQCLQLSNVSEKDILIIYAHIEYTCT